MKTLLPQKSLTLILFLLMLMCLQFGSAQSISYGYTFNISNATHDAPPFALSTFDTGPQGIAFNDDGTKAFVIGLGGDEVNQFSLATAYDITSGVTHDGLFSVTTEQATPQGIAFSSNGNKMFIIGTSSDEINQYSLSNAFDVTSGVSFDGTPFLTTTEEANPTGLTFNSTGTKMFVVGDNGDEVNQYSLTTPFDITSGVSTDGSPYSVAAEQTAPKDIVFSTDGTKMFIVGATGDEVNQYSLTTPFNITSGVSFDGSPLFVGSQEGFPSGIAFSPAGDKMFIVGTLGREINQYDLNIGGFSEVVDNDGSVEGSMDIFITGETFTNASGTLSNGADYNILNVPAGFTPSLAVAADGASATLTFSGNATAHQDLNDISDLQFTFENSAFTGGSAAAVSNAIAASSNLQVDFEDNTAALTYGFFHNLSNGATPSTDHSVASEESTSQSVAFSDDGLTMLVLGSGDDEVNQYSLTTAFDVSSGVSHAGLFSVASEVTAPNGMAFSADGTKMFLTGFENFGKVFQYTLTTPFVVTSGVSFDYFFNISGQEGTPQGITFNPDGNKMYVVGSAGDEVNQYSLSTPFDVLFSNVTFDNVTFSISGEDTFPTDIAFNPDGTKMLIIGGVGKDIIQYSLASPFDLSVGVTNDGTPFSLSSEVFAPRGLAFNDDGSRLFVVGSNDGINQYEVNIGGFEEVAGNDGSVSGSLTIHLVEDTFTNQGSTLTSGADYSIHNLPAGLTPSMAVAADGASATLTLAGTANDHQHLDDIGSLQFTFENSAFTTLDAATILYAISAESNIKIDFNDNPFLTYGSFFNLIDGGTYSGNSFDLSNETTSPIGLVFSKDGFKMFVMANDRNVYQYSLSTAFDLGSTITHDGSPYATGMNEPRELEFNPDGTKLFIVDNKLNQVNQFSLTTPFDITSGVTSDGSRSIVAQTGSDSAWGIALSASGTKMFISGIADDLVHQYTLEVPFDVTASVTYDNIAFDPTNELPNPTYLTFNPEGTVLYVSTYQYALATPFDLSSGVTPVGPSVLTNIQGASISGVHFSDDGTKLYLGSTSNDSVHEYLVNTGGFSEIDANDGEVEGSLLVSLTGDTFTSAGSTLTPTTDYSITNLPSGLTPTLTVAADGLTATLTLSGNSTAHQDANDLAGLDFTFENTAFTNTNATAVTDAIGFSSAEGIDFTDNFPVMVYDYGYNPANFSFTGSFGVLAQEGGAHGLTFNADGTKVYIVGTINDQIFQYSLASAFDVTSGVTLDGNSISLNAQDDSPLGLAFSDDGTSLFVAGGSGEAILEYALTTPYDVTTGFSFSSNSLDVSGEGSPSGLAFSEDGMKLFTSSTATDQVNQYSLTTAFDISSGVSVDGSYAVLDQENTPTGIAFNSSGTKMIIMGASTQASQKYVHNYHLENPFDITSGVAPYENPVNVNSFEFSPTDIAFSNDGDRMFIVGVNGDEINQFDMQMGSLTESASNDGSVTGSYTLQIYDDLFANAGGTLTQGADYSISNLPAGLSSLLAVAADGKTAVLSTTGMATSHDNAADVESLNFTFENSAFSIGNASIITHATSASSELAINFVEAPSIGNQTFSVAENSANATVVGTVTASGDGTLTYSVTAGNDLGGFALNTNSGEITVADQADMDFETNPSFDLTVEVSDGSLTNAATITIDLTNVPETPTDLAVDATSIDENNAVNDVIGQLSTTDVDAGETYTYTLVSGAGDTDNASFNINNDQLRASEAFDFETKDTYSIRVQSDDGNSGTFAKELTINIANVFEAPTSIGLFGSSIPENNSVSDEIGTLSTTDEDAGETYTYSFVSGTGDDDNASFIIADNKLQAGEVFNFESKNSYSVRIQTNDGNGNTFSDVFTINITNEAANITDVALDSENVDENEISGTSVGLLSTIGTEVTGTITYSLVSGTGDTDNASFAISGTQLTTASVFDFEADASYAIRVRTDDGEGVTFEKAFTIVINDVPEAPTDMVLSASNINENNSINATVGTLSTTDEDAGETYTYSLVSGSGDADNASFNVSGNLLRASEVFDFESKNSFSLRLQTNDGNGGTFQEEFTITINDASEVPTDLALSGSELVENNGINEVIGTLSTTDEDIGETFTYTLVSGSGDTDNTSFNVSGNQLRASEVFDFETKNSYAIRVQTNDGNGGLYEESFNVSVTNQPEAPTDLVLSSTAIDESSPSGSTIGTLSTVDEDNGETYTYSLTSGTGDTDNASFLISGNELRSAEIFDFETKTSYTVRIQTNDGNGGMLQEAFTISINNLPPGLTGVSITSNTIDEAMAVGTAVGNLFALGDEIDGVSFTFSLVSGTGDTDNGSFSIGEGQLLGAISFDHESQDQYSIRVMADDGAGSSVEEILLINVNDVNEAPTDIQLSASAINENNAVNDAIGLFTTTDEDAGDTHSYSLASGSGDSDNASFIISGGQLQATDIFDFETKASYSIRVRANDGNGGQFEKSFTISINDENDAPTMLEISASSLAENNAINDLIGAFITTDQDGSDSFTYSLVSGSGDTDNGEFNISGDQLQASISFDFESQSVYSVRVQTSDGNGGLLEGVFEITVIDANDAPTDMSLSANAINESSATGTNIGDFTTTDQDATQSHTYTLISGAGDEDNASFSISGASLISSEVFDFETKNSYSLRVRSEDGNGGAYEESFTISITDLPASVTAFDLSHSSIEENLPSGTLVGTLSTSGEDLSGSFTYSFASGAGDTDNASFSISGNQLLSAQSFNFESNASYSVRMETNDGTGNTSEAIFTLSVTDVSEAPTDLALSASSIDENNEVGDLIGSFTTTDEDAGETYTYTLVSGTGDSDNASFSIDGNELQAAEALDFETKSSYSIRVETNDGNGGTHQEAFIITVNDANENNPPVINASFSDFETINGFGRSDRNFANAFFDADGDELTISTSSSDETVVTSEFVGDIFRVNEVGTGTSIITVTVDDGNGGITSESYNFTVTFVAQAAPIDLVLNNTSLDENLPVNTVVANISRSDVNTFDDPIYTFASGAGDDDNGSFNISGFQLRTSEVFNFEVKSSYSIRLMVDDQNGGTYEEAFTITVNDLADNDAPTVAIPLADITEMVGFGTIIIDLTNTFADVDGDALSLSVSSSDVNVTIASIAGTTLTLEEVGIGASTITLTADDGKGGTVSDDFIVTVSEMANTAPVVVDPLSDQTSLVEGFDALQINYTTTFEDADGDDLTITVASSDETVVTATVISNNQIQIDEVGIGTSTITVTADDGNGGTVSDDFIVTVSEMANTAPVVVDPLSDQTSLVEGFDALQINYTTTFEDADGDDLTITVASSDETVVTATVISNNQIQIDEVGIGTSTITVTADDGNGGTVSDDFIVTVSEMANTAPVVVDPLSDQTSLVEGFDALQINYTTTFEDADGDDLTITVASSDETVVTATVISNNQIQIDEIGIGTSTITVTADDGNGGTVSDDFIVTVSETANTAPVVVDPLSDQTSLVEGFDALQINYTTTFEDADGDDLTITVASSDEAVVTALVISNNQIQIDEVGIGTSTITVTADDGNGGTVSDDFIVTVSEAPLGLEDSIEISVYPNPVTDFLQVKSSSHVRVTLVTTEGKELLRESGLELQLDLRSYGSGVYILLFNDGDKVTQKRIIKAN